MGYVGGGVYDKDRGQLKCPCGNKNLWDWISQGPKGRTAQCGACSKVIKD